MNHKNVNKEKFLDTESLFLVVGNVLYGLSLESGDIEWLHQNLPKLCICLLSSVICYIIAEFRLIHKLNKDGKRSAMMIGLLLELVILSTVLNIDNGVTLEHHTTNFVL